jgi:hypothetical protein
MAMSDECAGRAKAAVPERVVADLARRFRGFPVPEGKFDPSTASPELLRQYGLPPRPDSATQPLLRRAWDRGFGRPMLLQAFELDVDLVQQTRYRLFTKHLQEISIAATRFETSSDWSGAYITANRDKQFLQIWGMWTIPGNLKVPPAPQQGSPGVPYVCSNWIGLDGQRRYLDSSLPQMGTVSTLEADGTTTAQAWTQWWARDNAGNTPVPIGLAVEPGNEVLCVITAWDPQTVICIMVNLSLEPPVGRIVVAKSPRVELPDGSVVYPDIAGATAEWIMERPQVVDSPARYNFPDYGETEFDLCIAVEGEDVDISSWFDGLPQQLQVARRIRMFDVLQNPARTALISMAREINIDSVRIRYGGF